VCKFAAGALSLASVLTSLLTAVAIVPANAQLAPPGNLEKLSAFQQTGTAMEIPTVPHAGCCRVRSAPDLSERCYDC
jgi:hypothetical protein